MATRRKAPSATKVSPSRPLSKPQHLLGDTETTLESATLTTLGLQGLEAGKFHFGAEELRTLHEQYGVRERRTIICRVGTLDRTATKLTVTLGGRPCEEHWRAVGGIADVEAALPALHAAVLEPPCVEVAVVRSLPTVAQLAKSAFALLCTKAAALKPPCVQVAVVRSLPTAAQLAKPAFALLCTKAAVLEPPCVEVAVVRSLPTAVQLAKPAFALLCTKGHESRLQVAVHSKDASEFQKASTTVTVRFLGLQADIPV
eukprot:CAMPEP_0203945684 /NCGR_PEP_ID=MMETSP0359-20131031/81150_1 /ASSEMBLY_ACC=CAM_ASM_000338 /TAXON_ID=268821 /ORGANISM="Scrippsiella Hangoei, Strain SHTV-5" /LENGTH=257 /DNA_ID=CAMNT_0050876877 /DNA_START=19 /DNA_END=788 /DNA_ORIENTATION=-